MKKRIITVIGLSIIVGLFAAACNVFGRGKESVPQGEAVPAGPVLITGSFEYTNDFVLETYYLEHAVALTDMTAFVLRDREWELPIEGQVLGHMDLNEDKNNATYRLPLPAVPFGELNDVDNDGKQEEGVQIFAVAYSPNLAGGVFSEGDDRSIGWPGYLASVKTDSENKDEVTGGKLVIWAPDGNQEFPSGFGADGLLFTEDDPVTTAPVGYSVVDLDTDPFTFSTEQVSEIALYEPDDIAVKDFSDLSYTEAFEKMFERVWKEYAFNGVAGKEPDWDAAYAEIQPRVAQAQKDRDGYAFYLAMRDFSLKFNDGHVSVSGGNYDFQYNAENLLGGFGFAVREVEGGRLLVVGVIQGTPADAAGMQIGAELLTRDGKDVSDLLPSVVPWDPQSTDFGLRYQQVMLLTRTFEGDMVTWGWQNRGGEAVEVEMTAVGETDSLLQLLYGGLFLDQSVLPVEADILYNFVGYIKINSNSDDLGLILREVEHSLKVFEEEGIVDLIIDLRRNFGGASLGLAGLLYDDEIPLAQLEYYSDKTGQFEPEGLPDKILPNVNVYSFENMVLLVDQFCFSACEIEAYGFSQVPGMVVMGQFPTAGVEGETARGDFQLPEGISFTIPTGRYVLPDGSIFLEGEGVQPTVRIPVDAESVLSDLDVVLEQAVDYIASTY